jgi:hypothetical protein
MERPKLEVADVFCRYGSVYRQQHDGSLSRRQRRVMSAIALCRTAALARICSDDLIAGMLNRNGLKSGRGNRWTRERVTGLRCHHCISCYSPQYREAEGWMNLTEAAAYLGVSPRTVRLAVDRGEIVGEHPLPDGPWIFRRQGPEAEAARALVQRVRQSGHPPAIPSEQQNGFDFSSA